MKIFLMSLFFFPVILNAQDSIPNLPTKDGKVYYSGVVTVDSTSSDILFNRANQWFVDNYKSGKDVIQMSDKQMGVIVGKGYFNQLMSAMTGTYVEIWSTVKIQVRDGRYKYEITDFSMADGSYERWVEQMQKIMPRKLTKMIEELNLHILTMIDSLTSAMVTAEEEW